MRKINRLAPWLCALLASFALLAMPITASAQGIAAFVSPTLNETLVSRTYEYRITFQKVDAGEFYYLVHEINGMSWPKARLKPIDDGENVSGTMSEEGTPPGGVFKIEVIAVKEKEHQRILAWFADGTKNGRFPGLMLDGRTLASVQVRVR